MMRRQRRTVILALALCCAALFAVGCADGGGSIPAHPPDTGTYVPPDGGTVPPPTTACGNPGQVCCTNPGATACSRNSVCQAGRCLPCGGVSEICCMGTCRDGQTCTADRCAPAPACGQLNQACCAGTGCGGGLSCQAGMCVAATTCGAEGQPCCPSLTCNMGMSCDFGTARCRRATTGGTGTGGTVGAGCTNTCSFPNDGECDDGGPGAITTLCEYGTDCNDCGGRAAGTGGTGTGGAGTGTSALCSNSCSRSYDGQCNDGGPLSVSSVCTLGTDCADCGPRSSTSGGVGGSAGTPPAGPGGCSNDCAFASNAHCDDGGSGSSSSLCRFGTDCIDCGTRPAGTVTPSGGPSSPSSLCSDACDTAGDGECDDGGPFALYNLCEYGTDCTDCGLRDAARRTSTTVSLCTDSCRFDHDGDCDDGGMGADFSYCEYGTDCADCGSRSPDARGTTFDWICGGDGEQCCPTSGEQCDDGLECNRDGLCRRPTGCGTIGNACCLGVCGEGVCDMTTFRCVACGDSGEVCCPGAVCELGNYCDIPGGLRCQPCGDWGQECCPGATCKFGMQCSFFTFTCE